VEEDSKTSNSNLCRFLNVVDEDRREKKRYHDSYTEARVDELRIFGEGKRRRTGDTFGGVRETDGTSDIQRKRDSDGRDETFY